MMQAMRVKYAAFPNTARALVNQLARENRKEFRVVR